jgi:hypothetical protein
MDFHSVYYEKGKEIDNEMNSDDTYHGGLPVHIVYQCCPGL